MLAPHLASSPISKIEVRCSLHNSEWPQEQACDACCLPSPCHKPVVKAAHAKHPSSKVDAECEARWVEARKHHEWDGQENEADGPQKDLRLSREGAKSHKSKGL